jgi:tetratricopeptide (TPR) repeat protein
MSHFKKAGVLSPGSANPYHNYGLCLHYLDRHEQAIPYLKKALLLRPNHFSTHIGLAQAYLKLSDSVSALEQAALAAQAASSKWRDQNNLGIVWLSLREFEKAEKAFLKAKTLNSDRWEPHHNLGLVELQRGRPALALKHLHTCASKAPERAETLINGGIALLSLGKNREALQCFSQALQQDSTAKAFVNRAIAYEQLGDMDSAIADLRRAALSPDYHTFCSRHLARLNTALQQADSAKAYADSAPDENFHTPRNNLAPAR